MSLTRGHDFLIYTHMSLLKTMTVPELHERFCAEKSLLNEVSDETIKWYHWGFRNFRKFKLINNLADIDELVLTDFMFWAKKTREWEKKTLLGNYCSLFSFFSWCVEKKLLPTNPIENVPKPKLTKKLPKALSKQKAQELFEFIQYMPIPETHKPQMFHKRRNIAIFAMFLFTGLRRQELLNLKFQDVNFEEDSVSVFEGKGDKDRVIPMSFELKRHLQNYIKELEENNISSKYFFTTVQHQKKIGVRTLTRLIDHIKKQSGIHFSAHILRHTFATIMAKAKCDIYSLSNMLGHSDIKTTAIYLSTDTGHLKEQINNHPLNFI